MALFEWILKIIFWSWLGVFGIGLADLAMDLQKETVRAYQKGPISASAFTRMLTSEK